MVKVISSICVYTLAIAIDIFGVIFLVSVIKDAIKRR